MVIYDYINIDLYFQLMVQLLVFPYVLYANSYITKIILISKRRPMDII